MTKPYDKLTDRSKMMYWQNYHCALCDFLEAWQEHDLTISEKERIKHEIRRISGKIFELITEMENKL